MKHRPIGVGVQGLADVFAILRLPWTSKEARNLNREIFENMYFELFVILHQLYIYWGGLYIFYIQTVIQLLIFLNL